jgi:hypothetical protein
MALWDFDTSSSNNQTERIPFSRGVIIKVWNKEFNGADKGYCPVCRKRIITQDSFQMGHKVSLANGGSNNTRNLRPICKKCNGEMGSKNWRDFVKGKNPLPKPKKQKEDKPNPFELSFPVFPGEEIKKPRKKRATSTKTKKRRIVERDPFKFLE